ncbi:agmatinase [Sulfolobus acidocaldarius]|uniref:Agmatinase n=4 Tax=Sulfolobus acidocaldarius TaxID=2285 RepID=Q4JAE9_SULAC|nr:agmatinase [Sulfolobus acidocaldarius]AAY80230.1 agmatinase [Sulfolobus acidocaldarius DSM 639]AGE70809.1 agmatinase [Sulfolobus acidocaldarius N8]AGE73080.1 agmatinase [Sulfolobus acidocaldarius Ron12/I]ALU28873.1 agmatinase [Sulfolobus acidocaldarius]ALU31595.1 agmatinase [Sulfolobus acidocaldarius]
MVDSRLLYLNESSRQFAGFNKTTSPFVIVGIPLDITSSFRPGSRFAPSVIREVAQYIEFYSMRTGIDMGEIGFSDVGDIVMHPSNVEENIKRIKDVVSYFSEKGKIVVSIGGEHSITVGTTEGTNADCVLSIDAHLDLRDEYMGYKYDHACVMRRISERGVKIIELGTRAVSKEELEYANQKGIMYLNPRQVNLLGIRGTAEKVKRGLAECKRIYLTYDMDGIDPAYAPGVATPEPEGLDPTTVLEIVNMVTDKRIVGFDVVEISPPHDPSNITSVLASRFILETASIIFKSLSLS